MMANMIYFALIIRFIGNFFTHWVTLNLLILLFREILLPQPGPHLYGTAVAFRRRGDMYYSIESDWNIHRSSGADGIDES